MQLLIFAKQQVFEVAVQIHVTLYVLTLFPPANFLLAYLPGVGEGRGQIGPASVTLYFFQNYA